GFFGEADDRLADLLARLVGEHDGAEHLLFGELLGFGFDHHAGGGRAGDDEVEAPGLDLFLARIEDIFTIDEADAGGADRAHEGHAGDGEGGRRRDHRDDVGLVLALIGEHLRDAEDLVVEALGKEGADGTIDQAGGQRFLFGGAALALEEAARDTPGGREFFLVMDGQREEVLARLDGLGGGDRAKDDGFAEGREHRAVGLAGHAARFELEGLSAQLDFYGFDIKHFISLLPRAGWRRVRQWQATGLRAVWGLKMPLRPTAECGRAPMYEGRPGAPFQVTC